MKFTNGSFSHVGSRLGTRLLMHIHNSDLQVMSWALVLMMLLVVGRWYWKRGGCIHDPEYQKKKFSTCLLTIFLKHSLTYAYLTSLSSLLRRYLFQTCFLTQSICSLINLSVMKTPQLCTSVATFALNYSLLGQNALVLNVWGPMLVKPLSSRCFLISSYRIYFKISWAIMAMPVLKLK